MRNRIIFLLCVFPLVVDVIHGKVSKLPSKLPAAFHYDVSGSEDDWWTNAVFYQIYPISFQDSDGDGNGDLQGIIRRLNHLKDAGVTAMWLSPILQSPRVDQGYDISDYTVIDPLYGNLEDFQELVAKGKELGLKLVMDLVPNHTSDQHKWFQLSENRTEGYEDFYIWHDGLPDENNETNRLVPNNWISNFSGSAWTWNEKRQQFYYHAFEYRQPDLNYRNPIVFESMKEVMIFWLDQGIDGFRVDAVPYIMEDSLFRNEPLADGYTEYNVNDWNCLNHIYTKDMDATYDIVYRFREVVDQYKAEHNTSTKVMMTEAYSTINETMRYYGDGSRQGGHFTFNFQLITYLDDQNFTVGDIIYCIDSWLSNMPKNRTSNWVLGNHDNHRVATRLGEENVDAFNMLLGFLPGVMVTYNGEEIGMENGNVTCEQGHDPQAIKNCSIFDEVSRDFERTPYQWDCSKNAGFSTANETWLPVSDKYLETNLALQIKEGMKSHYGVYKTLLNYRKLFSTSDVVDKLTVAEIRPNVLQIIRTRGNNEYIYLGNFGDKILPLNFWKSARWYRVLVASGGSSYKPGQKVDSVVLKGHESLILGNFPTHRKL